MNKFTHVLNLFLALFLILGMAPTAHTIEAPDTLDNAAVASLPLAEGTDEKAFVLSPSNYTLSDSVDPQSPVVLGTSSASAVTQSSTSDWRSECVDCPKLFGVLSDRSLRLDSEAHPHIAYGGDRLYYAWHDGTQWHYETVDGSSSVDSDASLVLDEMERPHISYSADGSLKYAWRDETTGWQVEVLNIVGQYSSLALDSAGRPHISYSEGAYNDLEYAWYDGTDWQIEEVPTLESLNWGGPSLVLDQSDHPHISYPTHTCTYWSCSYLEYAWHDGTDWQVEMIDDDNLDIGDFTSLVLDEADYPHIGYADSGNVKYAWYDGENWQIEKIGESNSVPVSLALDGAGRPHIGYTTLYDYDIIHAWLDGTQWFSETVGNNTTYYDLSLAVDESGLPQFSYYEDDSLKHVRYAGTDWQTEIVDIVESVGDGVALALDTSTGQPHISYRDRTHRNLKYAWLDGTAWRVETVDEGDVGRPTALAVDEAGRPHISYSSGGDLRYAWYDGATWRIESVGNEYSDGIKSLVLDELGRPHIAYMASGYVPMLRYAWYDGTTWQVETIADDAEITSPSALALDKAGHPHIIYRDDLSYQLKHAWHDGTSWYTEAVDAIKVNHAALALDQADRLHIGYVDRSAETLKYAYYDETQWRIETVDNVGVVHSMEASLTLKLDASGRPHISYYDTVNDVFKYAWRNGASWYIQVINSKGKVDDASLALDNSGVPHIAYYDSTYGDLLYTQLEPPTLLLGKRATPERGLLNGDILTYTLTMFSPGQNVRLYDPLPPSVQYVPGSLTGTLEPAAVYSPTVRAIVWEGTLPTSGMQQTLHFQVTPGGTGTGSLALAPPIVNSAWLTDTESGWSASATTIVNGWRVYAPLALGNR